MKTYYNRLSSEEKKSLKKNIKNSKFNDLYKKVNYYLFLTYGCFFLVIADVYFRYYFSGKTIDYIVDAIIIIGLLIFYYKLLKLKETTLNKYEHSNYLNEKQGVIQRYKQLLENYFARVINSGKKLPPNTYNEYKTSMQSL